jgi:adenylate cyclase
MQSSGSAQGFDPVWDAMLSGTHPALRRGRHFFGLISPRQVPRCRFCLAPFAGFSAPIARAMGRRPWKRNPHFCEKCETFFREHPGGTEIEVAVLFADVRGSTPLAAGMRPAEFGALMQRFYLTANKVFIDSDAMVDKMMGDEVIGLFIPGLGGAGFRRDAVLAGIKLLRATGHGEQGGPWLSIGVGVHAGKTFVGSLGSGDGAYEFVALGDTMNLAARLVGAAAGGEIVISEAVWPEVAGQIDAEPRTLALKGFERPIAAHVARVTS